MIQALNDSTVAKNEKVKGKCLKIRASLENIVHGLSRVEKMKSRLPEIFCGGIDDDENGPEVVPNQSTIDNTIRPENVYAQGCNIRYRN